MTKWPAELQAALDDKDGWEKVYPKPSGGTPVSLVASPYYEKTVPSPTGNIRIRLDEHGRLTSACRAAVRDGVVAAIEIWSR